MRSVMTAQSALFLMLVMLLAVEGIGSQVVWGSQVVLPGPDKTFEQFQADDIVCRQWASQRVGQTPQGSATEKTIQGSVLGTFLGAGLGAAIGAATGNPGTGAAIGAGSGLLLGTMSGADAGRYAGSVVQQQYDAAYMQCMYAKGNQIPGVPTRTPPPARVAPPPPPPGGAPDRYDPPYPYPSRN